MQKSVKAALLSGLIFPGIGQISLGYKKRGWSIIVVNCILFYLLISNIMQQATSMVNRMQQDSIALDIESISKQTSDLVSFSDNSPLNTLLILLISCWLISIFDAYILGNK